MTSNLLQISKYGNAKTPPLIIVTMTTIMNVFFQEKNLIAVLYEYRANALFTPDSIKMAMLII